MDVTCWKARIWMEYRYDKAFQILFLNADIDLPEPFFNIFYSMTLPLTGNFT